MVVVMVNVRVVAKSLWHFVFGGNFAHVADATVVDAFPLHLPMLGHIAGPSTPLRFVARVGPEPHAVWRATPSSVAAAANRASSDQRE